LLEIGTAQQDVSVLAEYLHQSLVPGINNRRHTGGFTPRSVTLRRMMFV